jgi:protein-S-isoprenylcysteine O-methyltransferase Ste14
MRAIDYVLTIGWIAFWVYWLAAAVRVKSGRARWGPYAGFRLVIVVIFVTLGRAGAFHGHANHHAWLGGVGVVICALGLGLAIWARRHLGRNWGTPMSEKQDPDLVTTGPYRWIRNPIYSGLIVAGIGTALAISPQWLIVVAVIGAYFVYSAVMESRYMAAQFPETYPAYRNSTKMLMPFIF